MDSLTSCCEGAPGGTCVTEPPAAPNYVERLVEWMPETEVINTGKPGASSWDYLPGSDFWNDFVSSELPVEGVFILLGSNDATAIVMPDSTSADEYRANMQEIVDALLAGSVDEVIQGIPPDDIKGNQLTQLHIELHEAQIYEICERAAVRCGPNFRDVLDPEL